MTKMATIAEEYLRHNTIANMDTGDVGYAVPWAMLVDSDLRCYLDSSYTVDPAAGGTVHMRVARMTDGWHVWLHGVEWFRWEPRTLRSEERALPVVEVHK